MRTVLPTASAIIYLREMIRSTKMDICFGPYNSTHPKPQLDLLENDEVKTKRPSMWNIVLFNDNYPHQILSNLF